ncbi:hypothetical protein PMAYCL1PPCAC_04815, partial [Pristionchus mayeri]
LNSLDRLSSFHHGSVFVYHAHLHSDVVNGTATIVDYTRSRYIFSSTHGRRSIRIDRVLGEDADGLAKGDAAWFLVGFLNEDGDCHLQCFGIRRDYKDVTVHWNSSRWFKPI